VAFRFPSRLENVLVPIMKTQIMLLLGLVVSASAVSLRQAGDKPVEKIPVDLESCPLDSPVVALALSSDSALEETNGLAVGTPNEAAKRKALMDALAEYKVKKQAMQVATNNLMAAMEALLVVPAADKALLANVADGKTGKDSLVVFYAPWCPHCQTFVLHDKQGNPSNAPLELLSQDLAKDSSTKDVAVMRADVTVLGQSGIPSKFAVQGIPSVYFANKAGKATQFAGNPHSTADLTAFVKKMLTA